MRLRRSESYGVPLHALTVVAESSRFLRQEDRACGTPDDQALSILEQADATTTRILKRVDIDAACL
jgi:hypothetical protein